MLGIRLRAIFKHQCQHHSVWKSVEINVFLPKRQCWCSVWIHPYCLWWERCSGMWVLWILRTSTRWLSVCYHRDCHICSRKWEVVHPSSGSICRTVTNMRQYICTIQVPIFGRDWIQIPPMETRITTTRHFTLLRGMPWNHYSGNAISQYLNTLSRVRVNFDCGQVDFQFTSLDGQVESFENYINVFNCNV